MLKTNVTLVLLAAAVSGILTGCQSNEQKKQAAKLRWQNQTAMAKIPIAEDLLRNDQLEAAMSVADECLAILRDNSRVHLIKGKILFVQGKVRQAEGHLRTAVKNDSKLHEGWFWLGMLQQQTGDMKFAMTSYHKALELEPVNVDYIVAISEIHASQGDYETAINLLEEKSDLMPFEKGLKTARADLQLRNGNIDEAISIYNRVLFSNPDDTDVIAALGYCYVINCQWADATEAFEKLLAHAEVGQKDSYLKMLAAINLNSQQYGRAVGYYDSLILSKRNNADIWLKMGHAALGANAPNRALACSRRALNLHAGWPAAIALMGSAQYLNEDYTASLQSFERIRGDRELSCFSWLMTGRCMRKIGEHEMASAAFKKAASLDPENELIAFINK